MARYKLSFVFIQAIITFCLCEIDVQKKAKLVNGFVNFYNSLPNELYTCDEGLLQSAQQTDISNAYEIAVSLKVSQAHNLETTKYLKCIATVADIQDVGVAVMKHQCQDDLDPAANIANIEEPVVTEPTVITETPFIRRPIQLDNEVQTNTAVTSGEQFIAIPREEPKVHCIGCSAHVNPQAEGVSALADIGVRQLNSLEPNVQHTLSGVVDVERQVQVVNGVRYILTLLIDYNSCQLKPETDPCLTTKACKIAILEKPWMQLPDGSKYRAILSNNCTEEWRFGDDGVVVPSNGNKESNNINPTDPGGESDIKVVHNVDVQSQQKTEKTLTNQDIKNIEEQIVQLDQLSSEPTVTQFSPTTTLLPSDVSKEHVVKVESENQLRPNSIHNNEPQKVENLPDDKKKAIDDMIHFFNFAGFDSNTKGDEAATREKRSFDSDLEAMHLAQRFNKLKKSIKNAKYIYLLAQTVVDYLNDIDLTVKDRVLKDVITAEEERANNLYFYYIQFRTIVPCKINGCEEKDIVTKICNAIVANSEKNPEIMNVFCHVEDKINNLGKMSDVPIDDPVLIKLIEDSIKKIEIESQSDKARKLNHVIDASTQKVSGSLTKISIVLDQTDCEKSLPFKLRTNCSIIEEYGSQLCDVTIHERHWLKERTITYSCIDRPIDIRFSDIRKDAGTKISNDPEVLEMVHEALNNLEQQSNKNSKQILIKVNSVSTQLVVGYLTNIEFIGGYTTCPIYVKNEESYKCRLLENEPLRTCTAKVWNRNWREDARHVEVSCKEPDTETKRMKQSLSFSGENLVKDVDDPVIKTLAKQSLQKFLKTSGGQTHYSLTKIEHATAQVMSGIKYILHFKISPTDCKIDEEGNPSSSHCEVVNSKNETSCTSEIWDRPWQDKKDIQISCHTEYTFSRIKRELVGGPKVQDPNDPQYQELAKESLQKYLENTGNSQPHKIVSIQKVTTQVVSGTKTRIEFKISPEAQTSGDVISCKSEIWEQPWLNKKVIDVSCQIDNAEKRMKRALIGGFKEQDPKNPEFRLPAEISLQKHTEYTFSRVKRGLPGSPKVQDLNDPKYQKLAKESLQKYLENTGNSQPHKIVSIQKVTTQVVSGTKTIIEFKISPEAQTSGDVISCKSEIWEQPWLNKKVIDVSCQIDNAEKRMKRALFGGFKEQDPQNPKFRLLAEISLQKYLRDTGLSQPHEIVSIEKAKTQIVSGTRTIIDFIIAPQSSTSGDIISCTSDIWQQPWRDEMEITVNCELDNRIARDEREIVDAKRNKRHTIPNLIGGRQQEDPTKPEYKGLAEDSLRVYQKKHNSTRAHVVIQVKKVIKQIVKGIKYAIEFTTAPQYCADDVSDCDDENPMLNCRSVVLFPKVIKVTCKNHQKSNKRTVTCELDNRITRDEREIVDAKRNKRHTIPNLIGGRQQKDPTKPEYMDLAENSLRVYQKKHNSTRAHVVVKVKKVVKQIVEGIKYTIEFTAAPQYCADDVSDCDDENPMLNCRSVVLFPKVIKVTCKSHRKSNKRTVTCDLDNPKIRDKREIVDAKRNKRHTIPNSKGGRQQEDPTKPVYKDLAENSLRVYQKKHNSTRGHVVVEVKKVMKQVVEGIKYGIEFTAAPHYCADDVSDCNDENPLLNCRARVFERPRQTQKDIQVSCKSHQKRNKQSVSSEEVEEDSKFHELTEIEFSELNNRGKRQVGPEDDYIDEDVKFYYADRAVQQLNEQTRSSNLHKLITIHGVQRSLHMSKTPMIRMYIETAESYCLRRLDPQEKLAECEEMDANNHRLCLARLWPSPDDDMVLRRVSVVCDNDKEFVTLTGLSIPWLLKTSIQSLEKSTQLKYKLIHQGEPQLIPSLDPEIPMKLNFIVRTTNCSKHIQDNYLGKFNCWIETTKPAKACTSLIWLVPNSNTIAKLSASCAQTELRKKRSVSLNPANATVDDLAILNMVKESLEKLEMSTSQRYKQKVLKINSYSTKVTSGRVTTIDFEVGFTSCLKYEWVDDIKTCEVLDHLPRRHCISEVWERLWLNNGRNIEVRCHDEEAPLEEHVQFESAETATALANRALKHIEAKYPLPRKQKVVRIFSLDKQMVAGLHYRMKIEVGATNCSALSPDSNCVIDNNHAENKFCRVNVWVRPWTDHPPNFRVTCDYQESAMAGLYHQVQAEHLFRDFLATFTPEYIDDHVETQRRFEVFKANIRRIHELNTHERGTATYGVTRFADLTYEEFTKKHMGFKPSLRDVNQVPMRRAQIPSVDLPESFDWREHGAVTEVKDQGSCGSCWAFSVTGNIEGQWQLKSGKLVSLSEQELVDCDKMDDGCNGGLPDNAYRAIEQLGGLETESDYPYEAEDDKCAFNKSMSKVQITGAVNITTNETEMAKWLVKNGPISIGINANAMQFYMGGVSHPWKMLCSPSNLDHGVLIVGYGIKNYPLFHKRLPYWIVKNSWGPSWGEKGYYRVYRGDGTCGVNQMASSALI